MVTKCLPLRLVEKEAMMRIMKSNNGPPKTKSKAARLAKNVIKNCFIEAKKEASFHLRDEEGKDNGFAPDAARMDKS
jgi:hypothetical protein